jgi:hypothetical protein
MQAIMRAVDLHARIGGMRAALLGIGLAVAATTACGEPARFTVLENPRLPDDVAEAQYRVSQQPKDRTTIVSIFAGERPTGGWAVAVQAVGRDSKSGACLVDYKISPPNRDAFVTQALTYPAVAIRIEAPGCKKVQVRPTLPQR